MTKKQVSDLDSAGKMRQKHLLILVDLKSPRDCKAINNNPTKLPIKPRPHQQKFRYNKFRHIFWCKRLFPEKILSGKLETGIHSILEHQRNVRQIVNKR